MANLALSDFGIIGNQTSAALISRLGSIAWACLPYLDSPSCFDEIGAGAQGGRFQIMPAGDFRSEQRYLQRTQVLETLFETPLGRAILTDWMPFENHETNPPPMICRQVEVIDGTMNWVLHCQGDSACENHRDGILFRKGNSVATLQANVPLSISSDRRFAHARFSLEQGEQAQFSWLWGRMIAEPKFRDPKPTLENWRNLAHRCPAGGCAFAGPWHDAVLRSALTVKLLTSKTTGAIAQSITAQTCDQRYASLRNLAMTLQCMANLGHREECKNLFEWLADILRRDGAKDLQAAYTLDGGKAPFSPPKSFRPDVYGHVMMAVCEYYKISGEFPADLWPALSEIADLVSHAWRRPDSGPGHEPPEEESPAEHFTVSKVMAWVALDRASWLARVTGQAGSPKWSEEARILHKTICAQGFDPRLNSFVRSFSSNELDAATLLIPLVRFLPIDDPRVQGTLKTVQNTQGSRLAQSFLVASCLALSDRVDEASDRLAELCSYATPLGFFAEQIDPETCAISGNFPYAPAHIACINTALYIGMARGRQLPMKQLIGMPDRLSRSHSFFKPKSA